MKRYVQPAVVGEPLAPRQRTAVVREEEDDRVLGQSVGLELREPLGHLVVQLRDAVVELGLVGARRRRVGVEGRNRDRVDGRRPGACGEDRHLVGREPREHAEERRPRGTIAPVGLRSVLVPRRGKIDVRVVVGPEVVEGVVPGPAEQLRPAAHERRHLGDRAHVVRGTGRRGVQAGDQREAGRPADRRVRVHGVEPDALPRQLVDGRRARDAITVGREQTRCDPFRDDPEDVRARRMAPGSRGPARSAVRHHRGGRREHEGEHGERCTSQTQSTPDAHRSGHIARTRPTPNEPIGRREMVDGSRAGVVCATRAAANGLGPCGKGRDQS
jgi:hypothetical protein